MKKYTPKHLYIPDYSLVYLTIQFQSKVDFHLRGKEK